MPSQIETKHTKQHRKSTKAEYRPHRIPYKTKGKIYTTNGKREVARRARQIEMGQLQYWRFEDGILWKYVSEKQFKRNPYAKRQNYITIIKE